MRSFARGKTPTTIFAISVGGAIALGASTTAMAQIAGKALTMPSGLQIIDTTVGTGVMPGTGQTCVMHYTGWLYEDGAKGKKFDSLGRSRSAVRVPDRPGTRHQGLGRGRRDDEGRRQAHAHHPARARLRRTRRRRRHPPNATLISRSSCLA